VLQHLARGRAALRKVRHHAAHRVLGALADGRPGRAAPVGDGGNAGGQRDTVGGGPRDNTRAASDLLQGPGYGTPRCPRPLGHPPGTIDPRVSVRHETVHPIIADPRGPLTLRGRRRRVSA
jgi:hypothetical protein